MTAWREVILGAAVALASCRGGQAQESAEAGAARTDALHRQIAKVRDLARAGAGASAPPTCAGGNATRIATATPAAVDDLAGSGKTRVDTKDKLSWLTSSKVGALGIGPAAAPGFSSYPQRITDLQATSGTLLGVVDVGEDVRPKHVEGTTFTPGSFRATVVIYDYERASVVCQVAFTAKSSDGLATELARYSRRPKADQVLDDYVKEIRREGNAALGRASSGKLAFDW